MKTLLSKGLVIFLALAAADFEGYAQYTYTPLNVPGGHYTTPLAVSGHDVVGTYSGPNAEDAFLYNGSTFTTFHAPGAMFQTVFTGISGNTIVGYYATDIAFVSFLYSGGTLTPFNVPGSLPYATQISGISGDNIFGTTAFANGVGLGFVYNGGTVTTARVPGAYSTDVVGLWGKSIVGTFLTPASTEPSSFVLSGGNYSLLRVPGATYTIAKDSDGNDIVGSCEINKEWFGFVYNGSSYTTFSASPTIGSIAEGISGDEIVGYLYGGAESVGGFIATSTAVVPETTDTGALVANFAILLIIAHRAKTQYLDQL